MRVRTYQPSRRLGPFVRVFEVVEATEEMTSTLLPDPGIIVGFRYSGSATQLDGGAPRAVPNSVISGLRSTARRMRTTARGGIVLAKFREGGAAPFFPTPLHELFNGTISLDEVAPRDQVQGVGTRIADANDDAGRIQIFEDFLLARLNPRSVDPLVKATLGAIQARRGSIRIGLVARQLDISLDALEKRFRAAVGTSPKRLASILRLRGAIASYRSGASLGDLSHRAGYYDQSHFIRQFRSLVGEAPQGFLRSGRYW